MRQFEIERVRLSTCKQLGKSFRIHSPSPEFVSVGGPSRWTIYSTTQRTNLDPRYQPPQRSARIPGVIQKWPSAAQEPFSKSGRKLGVLYVATGTCCRLRSDRLRPHACGSPRLGFSLRPKAQGLNSRNLNCSRWLPVYQGITGGLRRFSLALHRADRPEG